MENQNNWNKQDQNHSHTLGHPPKKSYDPNILMKELLNAVTEVYHDTNEIKATAIEQTISSTE